MTNKISRPMVRFAVLAMLALGAGGCQTISDLDPTGLLSDDSSPAPDQFPADANASQAPDAGTTPDLASLPARPTTASTPAQQQQVAAATTADGTQAQYSGDALRAGTEAAAPAPGASAPVMMAAAPPAPTAAPPSASDAPPTASDAPPTASDLPPSAAAPTSVAGAAPAVGPAPVRRAANVPPPAEQPVQTAALPPPAPMATASAAPAAGMAPGAEPAVPAVPPSIDGSRVAMLTPPAMSDAALGFKPSTAPPLDPSISKWVSAPILAHYRQTASAAGSAGTSSAAVPAVSGQAVATPRRGRKGAVVAIGGPDMSGAVVANMDALSSTAAGAIAANYGGVPPTAIVYFTGDGTSLSPAARAKVRDAVAAFKAGSGMGNVRVVGHASSRTANMPVERHLEAIFEKSQKRANAVAAELIHEGVPADKVVIEAVGDSQPIYYESMPKGEDGNRRAEIFVQS